jgi:hypothetical protein
MAAKTREARQTWIYAIALALCVLALVFGLWNGLQRGHWEAFGLLAAAVAGVNMAILLRKELRKPHA